MERQLIISSNLAEVGYDPQFETLEIQFHHGGVYQYYNVPLIIFEGLMTSDSPGKFFNQEIKGSYPEARL